VRKFCLILTIGIALDQLLKWLLFTNGNNYIWRDFLGIQLSTNRGIAFSLPVYGYVSIVISLLLLCFLAWLGWKYFSWRVVWTAFGMGLIFAGAISNLFDRIFLGFVRDYLRIWFFPVFNLADIMIFMGVIILIAFYKDIWHEI